MKRKLVRVGLAVFGLLIGIVLALWFIGGRTAVYYADIEIAAAPDEVFQYLIEPDQVVKWIHGVTKIEPLTEGEHQVGGRARVTVIDDGGNEFVIEDEVLKSEPGQLLELQMTSDMFEIISSYDLHTHGSTTHISHTMWADYKGFVRIFAPFAGGAAQQQMADDLARLKQLIEADPS